VETQECSFCGKPQKKVRNLIAGPNVFICDACVSLCLDILDERTLSEREAFKAARYFVEQFNERENSEALMLLIGWMAEGTWDHDPGETADPAQWHDWVACVDRVISERTG